MLSDINSNNYIKETSIVSNELNIVQKNAISNVQPSSATNLEPKQTLLNKEVIVQLQEVLDYSILQISSEKEEIDFNGTPKLEWLKGRNDKLYNEISRQVPMGFNDMCNFKTIVEKNINSESISYKDSVKIKYSICSRENWIEFNKQSRAKTNDPIIHKVLDYMLPKTLQRIEVLKQYLSTKTIEPEIEFELKDVDIKQTTDIATINDNSYEETNTLLDFLVKDLEWYKWFLEDKKDFATTTYYLKYLQLTRSITHSLTINERIQEVL